MHPQKHLCTLISPAQRVILILLEIWTPMRKRMHTPGPGVDPDVHAPGSKLERPDYRSKFGQG